MENYSLVNDAGDISVSEYYEIFLALSSEEQNYWILDSLLKITLSDSYRFLSFKSDQLYITFPLNKTGQAEIFLGEYLLSPNISMPSDEHLIKELQWKNKNVLVNLNKRKKSFLSLEDLTLQKLKECNLELVKYQDCFERAVKFNGEFFSSNKYGNVIASISIRLVYELEYLRKEISKHKKQEAPSFILSELSSKLENIKSIIVLFNFYSGKADKNN